MAEASLQDRLRGHAKAFDGLLSLIPAKQYYGEDTSEQWAKKKQTKQEAAAARRLKLDPDSDLNRNAKDVMDERAKNKRKMRDLEEDAQDEADEADEADSYEPVEGVEVEQPGEGLKKKTDEANNKKQKIEHDDTEAPELTEKQQAKLSKKEEKRAAKKEKKADKKLEKTADKTDDTPADDEQQPNGEPTAPSAPSKKQKVKKGKKEATESKPTNADAEPGSDETTKVNGRDKTMASSLDVSGLLTEEEGTGVSVSESEPLSPIFDADESPVAINGDAPTEATSTTTSVSSTIPPSEKPKHIKIPADTTALRARLAAKIEALRAARKADGPDGKPIRTRQELIESRRRKQTLRKEHKRELRKQAKDEEERKREEALASNSPGVMSPAVELDEATGNFAFSRVAFGDGSQMSHDLSYVLNQARKKGPSDPKTALLKVQNQKKRLQDLDETQRNDIAEKETWLSARRKAQGERIRDDEAILKKTVKRKEVAKKKSEKAWQERASGVALAQKQRQRKREENLTARKEGKGSKGKKKGGSKGGAKGGKKKGGRPGFEGSLGVGGRKK